MPALACGMAGGMPALACGMAGCMPALAGGMTALAGGMPVLACGMGGIPFAGCTGCDGGIVPGLPACASSRDHHPRRFRGRAASP